MSTTLAAKLIHSTGEIWAINQEVVEEKKTLPADVAIASKALSADIQHTFTHQGGLTLNNPTVVNIFLGNWSAKKTLQQRLNLFTEDLLKSSVVEVLKQYGYKQGTFQAAYNLSTEYNGISYRVLNESKLALIIQHAINTNKLPEPNAGKETCYMIYLSDELFFDDTNLDVRCCMPNNNTAFGFHHFFKTAIGNRFIYSIMPSLNDDCVSKTCSGSPTCVLDIKKQTQEQRITQVAAHEFAEMVTDPLGDGWFDKKSGEEVADICNGGDVSVRVGANTWNMQTQFSLTDDKNTSGRVSCVANTKATTPIEFAQRLSNDDLLKLLGIAGALMFVSGLLYRAFNHNA